MFSYTVFMLVSGIVATVSAKEPQFIDCPGSGWFTQKCCKSDQLPKGCECYDISISSDYTNTFLHKPQCPEEIKAILYLYTRKTRVSPETIKAGVSNIKSTSYNGARKTMFIVHGFTRNGNVSWCIKIKDALLDAEDVHVIIVDWKEGAKGPDYNKATANTRTVGSIIARLIVDLNKYAGASFENFHLIGHSLGAHTVGYAGKEVFRLTNEKVGRISGLDPAGPNFEGFSKYVRIDSTDALFVDIIHTNAEPLIQAGLGIRGSVGHVDFYPNGGVYQPGCPSNIFGILTMLNWNEEKREGVCSHERATEYFTNSISKCRYNPPDGNEECTMGYHVSTNCRGDVSPTTTGTDPYC